MKKIYTLKQLFFFCIFFAFTSVIYAQISNIKYEYSCPCRVKVTYDLANAGDVILYYSPIPLNLGDPNWLPADTFYAKTPGTQIEDVWNCEADSVVYGVFYFKLELMPQLPCVMINGVCWATCNVDAPGTFAASEEKVGMFYQWNRPVGWSGANPLVNSNGGNTWDPSVPSGTIWDISNDPSPTGYRLPTMDEFNALADLLFVTPTVETVNGVTGVRFTDNNSGESIFLGYSNYRDENWGNIMPMGNGYYWSSEEYNLDATRARGLFVSLGKGNAMIASKCIGWCIRPVIK